MVTYHLFFVSSYRNAADALESESHGILQRYEVCDNVDLLTIVQEYETYSAVKFGRVPRLTRRKESESAGSDASRPKASTAANSRPQTRSRPAAGGSTVVARRFPPHLQQRIKVASDPSSAAGPSKITLHTDLQVSGHASSGTATSLPPLSTAAASKGLQSANSNSAHASTRRVNSTQQAVPPTVAPSPHHCPMHTVTMKIVL